MSDKSLYLRGRRAQVQQGVGCGEIAFLKLELSRLKAEQKRANEERGNCATRQDAKSEVFDYIEGLFNRVRRHLSNFDWKLIYVKSSE